MYKRWCRNAMCCFIFYVFCLSANWQREFFLILVAERDCLLYPCLKKHQFQRLRLIVISIHRYCCCYFHRVWNTALLLVYHIYCTLSHNSTDRGQCRANQLPVFRGYILPVDASIHLKTVGKCRKTCGEIALEYR